MDGNPILYAQKIMELLSTVPYGTANSALKIADNLLDYRIRIDYPDPSAMELDGGRPGAAE
jgi:hypothetical protein